MARFVRLRFAAVPMIAAAAIASTTTSGWAFSQQTLFPGGNGNYNFNYTDPNHPTANPSTPSSDSNGSGLHFNVEGQTGTFGGFQGGSRFFDNSNSSNTTAPYFHPPGNGN
jgi:hypothetical protein